jgi:uncharacterized membrane protein
MMFMSVFWILIIVGLFLFFMKLFTHNSKIGEPGLFHGGTNSVEILKERYAKGVIDRNEFEQKMNDLKNAGI